MWNEIIYPNFNSATTEVWEWISNSIFFIQNIISKLFKLDKHFYWKEIHQIFLVQCIFWGTWLCLIYKTMVCHIFDARPALKPTLFYHQWDPIDSYSVQNLSKFRYFQSTKCCWNYHLQSHHHLDPRHHELARWCESCVVEAALQQLIIWDHWCISGDQQPWQTQDWFSM